MTTARQKVLIYLKKQRTASAAQIGRALGMSAANVRHHLSLLMADGRVTMIGKTHKGGRGRPVKIYGPSESVFGNNWLLVSGRLLDEIALRLGPSAREQVLRALAHELALASETGQTSDISSAPRRLAQTVERLNGLHYEAKWEAGAEGPRILFARCPYSAIIERHPELCRMDAILLEEMTGGAARQLARIGDSGSSLCVFALGKTGN
jgi:predicted ArsR family transcriptional regulator